MAATADAVAGDSIKPYTIHVPTKFLDITRQKLELTRLPHEGSAPKSNDWWEPKPLVEPLIDFWIDKYSWRDHEKQLNGSWPQFRTAVSLSSHESPLRIHFIHVPSAHARAIPLLLIPPFPFTNLSFGHLVKPLTDPEDPAENQPFHLVIPSLPGLGFSDALPNNTPPIAAAAELFNTLMSRLSYPHYLATSAAPGHLSPAHIDWRLIDHLATHHPSSCLGAHFISPPLASPKIQEAPWEWAKWNVASFFRAGVLGYSDDDFTALDRARVPPAWQQQQTKRSAVQQPGLNALDLREPNTLAYALCDSPTGMLAFVLKGIRALGPPRTASFFDEERVITLTNLAWLPGPETAMRFWAHCATHPETTTTAQTANKTKTKKALKPKVAITVFVGGKDVVDTETGAGTGTESGALPQELLLGTSGEAAATTRETYVPPAWGNARYNVLHTQRALGRAAGFLAFERPGVIVTGVRGLAKELLARDSAAHALLVEASAVAALEQVVVDQEQPSRQRRQSAAAAAATATAAAPAVVVLSPELSAAATSKPSGPALHGGSSSAGGAAAAKGDTLSPAALDKGKGKEIISFPPPAPPGAAAVVAGVKRDSSLDGESPDTLVGGHSPSPLPTPSPLKGDDGLEGSGKS
ncbi:Alpha/Beta hydrolase protein [Bombardia bombarda]|uniref:Alpha/Beta hydrolase protein n=1 Tax=Bombardia bombarda TaxID=252184 RepID=A0AA39XJR2_9PEZI|nr:Alpha/Beta hydrolase protein [Bombardia bombarda]